MLNSSTETPALPVSGAASRSRDQQQHFPFKLYDMLEYAADSEYCSTVSWVDDGRAFVISDKDMFMEYLVPLFFKQTKFRSFVSATCVVLPAAYLCFLFIRLAHMDCGYLAHHVCT